MLEEEAMASNMQLWLQVTQQPGCCCFKTFWFALLCLIGVLLIFTESTDNNEFPGFDWLWSLIITLWSRLGACFEWVSDQRMQILVRRWRQFPPKFDFNIHLRVKSLLMRDYEREKSLKKDVNKCVNSRGCDTEFSFDKWVRFMRIFWNKGRRFNHMGSYYDSSTPLSKY